MAAHCIHQTEPKPNYTPYLVIMASVSCNFKSYLVKKLNNMKLMKKYMIIMKSCLMIMKQTIIIRFLDTKISCDKLELLLLEMCII